MNNISFTSRIKLVTLTDFTKMSTKIDREKAFVDSPWTYKQTLKAPSAYTSGILDCTAGGVTDGHDVVMFHICPTERKNIFSKVAESILSKIDKKSPCLQGFLLGSNSVYGDSARMFERLNFLLDGLKVPTTTIKGTKVDASDILYNSLTDEWLISSNSINHNIKYNKVKPMELLKNNFESVYISPKDELVNF